MSRRQTRPSGRRSWHSRTVVLSLIISLVVMSIAALLAVANAGYAPRQIAPWIARRAMGHAPWIEWTGRTLEAILIGLDRPATNPAEAASDYPAWRGAQVSQSGAGAAGGQLRKIFSGTELVQAIGIAEPGDTLQLEPGRYTLAHVRLDISRPGTRLAPIRIKAAQVGQVILEFDLVEGFHVQAPYWHFENLVIRGICKDDSYCEHAFHVTGDAHGVVIRNNRIEDFNAHIKINAENGRYPDAGVIEHNTLTNNRPRDTSNPVTPIDLVAASDWRIEGNLIADFIKLGGNRVSYGAFAKGAGERNRFLRNVVLCEHRLRGLAGQRVGLSLGGGSTDKGLCRDAGRCVLEQVEGEISNNLIAQCSDVGVYLNKAANSLLTHNTVLDTAGVLVRFPESSARLSGNLIDGAWNTQADGLVHDLGNHTTHRVWAFLGVHPVRRLFVDAALLDLRWRDEPAKDMDIFPSKLPDLCGRRPRAATAGAFADFSECLRGTQ